jgi:uncharacterized protein YycO
MIRALRPLFLAVDRVLARRAKPRAYPKEAPALRTGDVIVTRTRWRLTNLLIPGYFKHAAMYVGGDLIVEAVWPDVRYDKVEKLLGSSHKYAVLRPKQFSYMDRHRAAERAESFVGRPYDVAFEVSDQRALYCSEAVWAALKHADRDWGMELRKRVGVWTVTPNDLYLATTYFEKVW